MNTILVVDDEPKMRNLVRIHLKNAGYSVVEASDGLEALRVMEHANPSAIILDVMMPQLDGFETCARIREKLPEIPILMLTARATIEDKVDGLKSGADDYVTKPFDGRELVARLQAHLRRAPFSKDDDVRIDALDLTIHVAGRTAAIGSNHVSLTQKEFDVLLLLARHPGRTFPREEILDRVWSMEYEGETRTVDSHMKNIREKLRDAGCFVDPIKTVWGIGYKFEALS